MKSQRALRLIAAIMCIFAAFAASSAAFALPALPEQEVLSVGDYGPDVAVLQTELKALNFYSGEVTSLFDAATRDAVSRLQRFLGVNADGAFGPITYSAYAEALLVGRLVLPSAQEQAGEGEGLLAGRVIGIDPGHQEAPDNGLEQMAPDTKRTKERQSAGSTGVKTGVPEYRINLLIACKLRDLLTAEGATVVLTRESSDISLSNRERAELMNAAEVDVWIRLHCDSAASAKRSGASVLTPSRVYCAAIYEESHRLGECVFAAFGEATGAEMIALAALMNQTGFNWSAAPVIAVEMGMLSNPQEDIRLNRDSYQMSCAIGLYNGVLAYFTDANAVDTIDRAALLSE